MTGYRTTFYAHVRRAGARHRRASTRSRSRSSSATTPKGARTARTSAIRGTLPRRPPRRDHRRRRRSASTSSTARSTRRHVRAARRPAAAHHAVPAALVRRLARAAPRARTQPGRRFTYATRPSARLFCERLVEAPTADGPDEAAVGVDHGPALVPLPVAQRPDDPVDARDARRHRERFADDDAEPPGRRLTDDAESGHLVPPAAPRRHGSQPRTSTSR